jgi:hypothetical protein
MNFEGERGSYMANLGIGTQHKFSKQVIADLYGGCGFGSSRSKGLSMSPLNANEYVDQQASFRQYWIQASVGFRNDSSELAYQLRATNVHFVDFHEATFAAPPEAQGLLTALRESHADHPILEHSFICRTRPDKFRTFFFLTIPHALKTYEGLHSPVNMGLGLELRLH